MAERLLAGCGCFSQVRTGSSSVSDSRAVEVPAVEVSPHKDPGLEATHILKE